MVPLGALARGQAAVHRPVPDAAEMLVVELDALRRRGPRDELRQLLRLGGSILAEDAGVEIDALLGERLLRLLQHRLQVLALRLDPELQVSLHLTCCIQQIHKSRQSIIVKCCNANYKYKAVKKADTHTLEKRKINKTYKWARAHGPSPAQL